MIKKLILVAFLTQSLFPFFGCQKLLFVDPSELSSIVIENISFKEIKINSSFYITLKQDSFFKLELTAPIEIGNNLEISISGDTLLLNDNNQNKWRTGYPIPTITIYFPEIEKISVYAPANINSFGGITLERLRLFTTNHIGVITLELFVKNLNIITGNTDNLGIYNISGRAFNANIWMRNRCSLNAFNLETDNARIVNNSIGDCYVHSTNSLRVTLNSAGNIYYRGYPNEIVIEEQSSTGRLINMD